MSDIQTIQFKRILSYTGNLSSAVENITNNLTPKLQPGEPLVCSYDANGITKYLLAIGVQNGNVRIIPAFIDESDIIDYIKANVGGLNLKDQISDSSDIIVENDGDKLILKIKDEFKNV